MYKFPENLYTDIRIEEVTTTLISYENLVLAQNKTKTEKGAMIRMYDGYRWYYSSITTLDEIQEEINKLSLIAKPNPEIYSNPIISKMEVNKGEHLRFAENSVTNIGVEEKEQLVRSYIPVIEEVKEIQKSTLLYMDNYTKKQIISSKGTDLIFDTQNATLVVRYVLMINGLPQEGRESTFNNNYNALAGKQDLFRATIKKDIDFALNAVPVEPGVYTCILSPITAGVFAHDSFGHKSEADFMIGDETMMKEWAIGSKVGAPILNIIDTGLLDGSGYVPFDDEGCSAKENYVIKDGLLTGRLHSSTTAASLGEEATGNARAMNFEFEPIVRMTTTYIGKGDLTKEELFAGVKSGLYIEEINHGSGMTTFTIAPSRSYLIKDGKIDKPVKISVITGNVMKTLKEIDGLSDTVEILSFGTGGCGKMEQYPLRVGFGGPYVRVNGINVQ